MNKDIVLGAVATGIVVWGVSKAAQSLSEDIQWAFDGIGLRGVGFSDGLSLEVEVRLRITNKTGIDIPIQRFVGVVAWQGKDFVKVNSADYAIIQANNVTVLKYVVPVKVDHIKTIFGSLDAFKKALKPSNWRLRGFAEIRKGVLIQQITIDEPFSISGVKK